MIHTKLHIPQSRSGDIIPRLDLIEWLNEGLHAKLTAVTAPPGYGKTTSLIVWARQSGCSVSWVSLDRHDNDMMRFWRYVVAAVRRERTNFGEHTLLTALVQQPDVRFMDMFIEELHSFQGELAIVLDDYHVIELNDIHESLSYLLEYLPRHIHLYIASRSSLPIPVARLLAKGEMRSVTMDELRIGLDDGIRFFRECMGIELSNEDAAMFVNHTEGWISGLHLAAIALRKTSDPSTFIRKFSGRQRGVANYLMEEVLVRQTEETQLFLLQASILSRMNAPLCEAITGMGGAQRLLESCENQNLFITSLDETGEWYRFHHLFAEFLAQQFQKRMPERWGEAHAAAACWLEASGEPAAAVEHLMTGGRYAEALELFEKHLTVLQDHRSSLLRWLEAIPEAILRSKPLVQLLYLKLMSDSGDYHGVYRQLRRLESAIDSPDWKPWLSVYYFLSAENALYCRKVPESLDNLQLYDLHEPPGIGGMLQMVAGNSLTGVNIDSLLSFFDRMQDAEHYLLNCIRIWESKGNSPFLGYLYYSYSDLLIEWNRLDEAEAMLRRMFTEEWQPYARNRFFATEALAKCRLMRGETADAFAMMADVHDRLDTLDRDLFLRRLHAETAYMAVYADQTERVTEWLQACGLKSTDRVGPAYREYYILARALAEVGRTGEALELIDRIERMTEQKGWLWDRIRILIVSSIVLDKHGSEEEAIRKLEAALHLAEPQGFVRSFVNEAKALGSLFVRYLRHRQTGSGGPSKLVSLGYVKKLLILMNVQPDAGWEGPALLTRQESRVLQLVDRGYKNREIAEQIGVSDETVKKHLKNIYQKLQVTSRIQAVNIAKESRLI
jgi:LuxR family transcriptional regulator, maltose regulon positive regulatory protein